jgi:fumarylacetoacetate (FAA) hydrolase
MKLAHYIDPRAPISCLGIVHGDEIFDIRAAWQMHILEVAISNSLLETLCLNLENGSLHHLEEAIHELEAHDFQDMRFPLSEVELLPPVHPVSFRDFYAFEQHVKNARKKRGLEMVAEWYEAPVFYFSNTAGIVGPGVEIRKPAETNELDYELEVAVVIGRVGGDIALDEADEFIAGFTILNDWSARDIQRREMKVGLGPAKGKDFATSIGPFLVTPDDLADRIVESKNGNRYDLTMTATVNGKEYSRGNLKDMNWTFAELIVHASRNTVLKPGDLIGSGTVGTGCITEFADGIYPWLQPGDLVRLEVERLGTLENPVVE